MEIKKYFEDFEKQFLYEGDKRKSSRFEDKELNRFDLFYAFSCYVNYHTDTCIYIIKDANLCSYFWRDIKRLLT